MLPHVSGDYAVIYLSAIDWAFRKQDHQFISTELAARGHRVLFVENTGARLPRARDLSRVVARLRAWSRQVARPTDVPAGIEIASPLCIPGAQLRVERLINQVLLQAQLGKPLERLGDRDRVLWIGLPTWAAVDLAARLRPALTVYYCGDAFGDLPGLRSVHDSEREIVRLADIVFATSGRLVAHLTALGAEPVLVPVAIDTSASRSARDGRLGGTPELDELPGRLIGYMGGLNYKVDAPLLEAVAARFPNHTLVILGSVEDPRSRPRSAPNIVILGERPYERIGAYLARFAVCLIPYRLNDYTASVNPAKLLEYLAVGRPVVSTPLPEVLPFADVVRIARSDQEFLAAVADALESDDDTAERAARVRRADENSYERVGALLVDVIERRMSAQRPP